MTTHSSGTKSTVIGAIVTLICKIDFITAGQIGHAFVLGVAGAAGGYIFNRVMNYFSKK